MAGSVGGKRVEGVAAFVNGVEVAASVGFSMTVVSLAESLLVVGEALAFSVEKARATPRMKEAIASWRL